MLLQQPHSVAFYNEWIWIVVLDKQYYKKLFKSVDYELCVCTGLHKRNPG